MRLKDVLTGLDYNWSYAENFRKSAQWTENTMPVSAFIPQQKMGNYCASINWPTMISLDNIQYFKKNIQNYRSVL